MILATIGKFRSVWETAREQHDGLGALVARLIREHGVGAIIHFAASIVVPDSVRDPLGIIETTRLIPGR